MVRVPELFGQQARLAGESFHCLDEWQRITAGGKFVVTALAGEDRPGASLARPIVGAAVGLLAVSVEGIPAPARAAGKVTLEPGVIHLDGIQNDGIVGRTNAQTHEVQKITADDLARRPPPATAGQGHFQHIRIRVRVGR